MGRKKLPVGIENFEEFSAENFYYVDKTMFIAELLQNWGKVNLFTRPRRFGKSLNMSMLKCFFEIGGDQTLFDGLKITEEKSLCEEYMGQFPVISISLKSIDGPDFEAASAALRTVIGDEAGDVLGPVGFASDDVHRADVDICNRRREQDMHGFRKSRFDPQGADLHRRFRCRPCRDFDRRDCRDDQNQINKVSFHKRSILLKSIIADGWL